MLDASGRSPSASTVHVVSSKFERGLDALAPYLGPGQTVALVGSSGVGKSTSSTACSASTASARRRCARRTSAGGTRRRTASSCGCPGGALLVDTPGMRELQLWSVDEGVREAFDDITALAAGLRVHATAATTPSRAAR